jgi:hypothetical protein
MRVSGLPWRPLSFARVTHAFFFAVLCPTRGFSPCPGTAHPSQLPRRTASQNFFQVEHPMELLIGFVATLCISFLIFRP